MALKSFGFYFRAYDRAAIKFRGVHADINFNINDYNEEIKQVKIWLRLISIFLML